ncbi:hypothetical protein QBC47DRAFT_398792 [Echria macrotheca]|uniref:Glycosyl transferase CAP10 domain-containing protein n=1 Tax=Echria macrotheca TaxID=438768 RepID=A0AAJ0BL59_9PEZI|nr:hypothetical protein QBC47DRAFT_398792 [Echria macrotheca]
MSTWRHLHPSSWVGSKKYNNLRLTKQECAAAFPGLTDGIDRVVSLGPFTLPRQGNDSLLLELYILHAEDGLTPELVDSQTATLHQLHRAILTSPFRLSDTIVTISIRDQPLGASFTYARPAYAAPTTNMPPITRAFVMPHFAWWAWPQPFIGSISSASVAIDSLERDLPFSKKDPGAVWRGTLSFENVYHPRSRQDLLRVASGKEWADVQPLEWTNSTVPSNAIPISDFCRYKYVIYTEGITYSGRLPFLQMCRSVLVTIPIVWLQHTTHLVRPVFSTDLLGHSYSGKEISREEEDIRQAWPKRYQPHEANAVFVSRDWTDLEETVAWLEAHPAVAEKIASNQRELFVGGGYFSPAAEVCYWRALIQGWASAARIEPTRDGIPWEESLVAPNS